MSPWLPWCALPLVAGAACAVPGGAVWPWVCAALAPLPLAVLAAGRLPLAARLLLALAALCAGRALGAGAAPPPLAPADGALAVVVGTVRWEYTRTWDRLIGIEVDAWELPATGAGPVRLTVRGAVLPPLRPGDRVRARGAWRTDPRGDRLDAVDLERVARREDGARGFAWRALAGLGAREELAGALLIGTGRPPEAQDFRTAGLAHVLAVSGMHLAIAAALTAWLLRVLGVAFWWRLGALATLVCGYAWLTGGSPATLRALVMALAVTLAAALARCPHRLGPVALAALALVLVEPALARDLGFQLSLAAVLGIVTLGLDLVALRTQHLPLQPWPLDRPAWRVLLFAARATLDGLAIGIAAWLATAPLVAAVFLTANPWGAPATLVTAPIATAALWLGLPLLCLGWLPALQDGLQFAVGGLLDLLAQGAHLAAQLPGAQVAAMAPHPLLALVWPLLFLVPLRDRRDLLLRTLAVAAALVGFFCG